MKYLPSLICLTASSLPLLAQDQIDSTTITVISSEPAEGPTFGPEKTLDGLTLEGWQDGDPADPAGVRPAGHQGNHWITQVVPANADGDFTASLTYDLGGTYNLSQIQVLNTSNSAWNERETNTFTIETSTDNASTFSTPSAAQTLLDYTRGFQIYPVSDQNVTHVRLNLTNLDEVNDDQQGPFAPQFSNDKGVGLNEVRFFEESADSDGDNLGDSWEIANFGDLSRDGTEDEDLPAPDGLTNLEEYNGGINSTDPKSADSDGDTLSDGDEINVHSTNPNNVDSDGDTLSDGDEINVYSTDPNSTDSDGDNINDGVEVNTYSTDPALADTDGDDINDDVEIFVLETDPLVPNPRVGLINPTTITVTATDELSAAFTAQNLVDDRTLEGFKNVGDPGPPIRPTGHQNNHWITASSLTASVTFDLGGTYDLTRLEVLNTSNTNWNDRETDIFTIETSTDGGNTFSTPSTAISLQDYTLGFQSVPFTATAVTHVRLNVENDPGLGVDTGTGDAAVGLNEVQFYTGSAGSFGPEISTIAYVSGDTEATITWNSNPGSNYLIEFSDDLIQWDEAPDGESVPASAGTTTSFTIEYDPVAPVAKRFFRVTLLL